MNVRLFNRRSRLQKLLKTVNDALDASGGSKLSGPVSVGPDWALPDVPRDKALKAGLIAGGLAGLTAGSAGISSLRRRREGARDDS